MDKEPIARYVGKDMRWFYHVPALRFFNVYDDYVKSYIGERSGSSEISNGGFFVTFTPTEAQFQRLIDVRGKTVFVWDDPAEKEAAWENLLSSTQRAVCCSTGFPKRLLSPLGHPTRIRSSPAHRSIAGTVLPSA